MLSRLLSPLGQVLLHTAQGELDSLPPLQWSSDSAVTVVIASENYPESPVTGDVIEGLELAKTVEGVDIFHAGTRAEGDDILSAGGRVLSVTALGKDLTSARSRAYEAISHIRLRGSQYRRDIAQKASENQG